MSDHEIITFLTRGGPPRSGKSRTKSVSVAEVMSPSTTPRYAVRRAAPREIGAEVESVVADLRGAFEILVLDAGMSKLLISLVESTIEDQSRYESLIETMMPREIHVSAAAAGQAQQNAQLRTEFLTEQPLLTSTEVGNLRQARSRNASAPASRLVQAGRIFGVAMPGSRGKLYPAWQFREDGEPLPEIKEILSVLRSADFTDWAIALWFTSPTGWLDDEVPAEALSSDPESVVEAARNEIVSVSG